MLTTDLDSFSPSEGVPLVMSFVDMLQEMGLTTEIAWDHWDFRVYNHEDVPLMVLKSVKNRISPDTLTRLLTEETRYKMILVDGDRPDYDLLMSQRVFLATSGTGVYVRGVGWLSKPSGKLSEAPKDLRLRLAPRWSQDETGRWLKKCTTCEELKGTDDFYASAYKTAKDPYRNICKECMTWDAKIRAAVKKEERKAEKAA